MDSLDLLAKPALAAFTALTIIFSPARALAAEGPKMEPTEWTKIEVAGADQPDAKRALFIGDSILGGYFWDVKSRLGDAIKCASFETSKSVANPDFTAELSVLLKRFKFSIIHMNNGLHGMSYTEQEYALALASTIDMIRKEQPEARIIWATTTPVRSGPNFADLNKEHAARAQERNKIAAALMKKYGFSMDDLYALVVDHPEYFGDGTHYNEAGRKVQGDQVEQAVRAQMK